MILEHSVAQREAWMEQRGWIVQTDLYIFCCFLLDAEVKHTAATVC